jgi:hypothetical protein
MNISGIESISLALRSAKSLAFCVLGKVKEKERGETRFGQVID